MSEFDLSMLREVCGLWPGGDLPASQAIGTYERIRQVLEEKRNGRASNADLIPLIRQVLLAESTEQNTRDLRVPSTANWPTALEWRTSGFVVFPNPDDSLTIRPQWPRLEWLGEGRDLFDDAFVERPSRVDLRIPMDPFLRASTGYEIYTSPAQREALRAMFHLPDGHTLIANLPTGTGKSLLPQAAVLLDGARGHLVVAVVPTIGLAIDQARRMSDMIKESDPSWIEAPLAYHSGLQQDARQSIRTAIREGRQRIVFTSPESLIGSLRGAIESAAHDGLLRYLIVDEAHLIGAWGDAFRPAFQVIPGFIAQLRRTVSGPLLRIVLASATLSEATIKLLQHLFGPISNVHLVSGVHLRSEPRYWFNHVDDGETQERRVVEAVLNAPRPFILYTTTRKDAQRWLDTLQRAGYRRLDLFCGDTPAADRERVLKDWSHSRIDGVVATSAFGLGIDKHDVRTVIHATLPESLDRFYQEVGRGGRDGNASSSLLIYWRKDERIANRQARPLMISNEIGYERWKRMFDAHIRDAEDSDLLWINLDVLRAKLQQRSKANRSWNLATLTLMARAGLISLQGLRSKRPNESVNQDASDLDEDNNFASLRIENSAHYNEGHFSRLINEARWLDTSASLRGLTTMHNVAMGLEEISVALRGTYEVSLPRAFCSVATCCGGCPQHWDNRQASGRYRSPVVTSMPCFQRPASVPASAGSRLLARRHSVVMASEQAPFDDVALSAVELVFGAIEIHTLVVGQRFWRRQQKAIGKLLTRRSDQKTFLEIVDQHQDLRVMGRPGESRLIVLDCEDDTLFPRSTWSTEADLELLIAGRSLKDPDHPLRAFADTNPIVRWDEFAYELTT